MQPITSESLLRAPGEILAPSIASIPTTLRAYSKRWAPWEAVWKPERGKFDKVPKVATKIDAGVSTKNAWWPFDTAVAGYEVLSLVAEHGGGVGFNMTKVRGLVGIDLDKCITDGQIAPWAMEIVTRAASYAEISPSGNGLRIFVKGTVPQDWNDHGRGIEVYAGHEARFLTITGCKLDEGADDVQPAPEGFLEWLQAEYPPKVKEPTAPAADLPDLIDEDLLPDLDSLTLPDHAREFLRDGEHKGDRSRALTAATLSLYEATTTAAGELDDALVLSILRNNPHAWEIALNHRRNNDDKALDYLWQQHCTKQRGKVASAIHDFDVIEQGGEQVARPLVESYTYDVTRLKPVEFVIDGFIRNGITVIAGAPGVGKTSLLVPLAAAVAHLFESDLAPDLRRKVVYFSEAPEQVETVLYGLARHAPDARVAEFAEWFKLVPSRRIPAERLAKVIGKAVRDNSVTFNDYPVAPLIVLDTSNANVDLENENDNAEVGKAIAAIKENLGNGGCWLVHHTAKALKRADVTELTARGAGAFAGDANATAFVFSEEEIKDKRFMWVDKHRFEATFRELEFTTQTDAEIVPTPWGMAQRVTYRVGIPAASDTAARIAEKEKAREQREQARNAERIAELGAEITDFIKANGPSSRNAIEKGIKRQAKDVRAAIDALLVTGGLVVEGVGRGGGELLAIGEGVNV